MNNLQRLVIDVLDRHRFSEKQLGHLIGVSQPTVHRYKTGKSEQVNMTVLEKLTILAKSSPTPPNN